MVRRRNRSTGPQPTTSPETNIGYRRLGLDPDNWLDLTDEDVIVQSSAKDSIITLAVFFERLIFWASKISGHWPAPDKNWFTENGAHCQILRTKGGGWQEGRFRFRLEFIPADPDAFFDLGDEPEILSESEHRLESQPEPQSEQE